MKRCVVFGVKAAPVGSDENINITDLDHGSLGIILSHLSLPDICALKATCKAMSTSITRQDTVWRQLLINMLPFKPYCLPKAAPSARHWYNVVKHYCTSLQSPSKQVKHSSLRVPLHPSIEVLTTEPKSTGSTCSSDGHKGMGNRRR